MDSVQNSNLQHVSRFLSQIEKLSEIKPHLIVRCAIFPAVQLNSEWEIRSERGEPHPHLALWRIYGELWCIMFTRPKPSSIDLTPEISWWSSQMDTDKHTQSFSPSIAINFASFFLIEECKLYAHLYLSDTNCEIKHWIKQPYKKGIFALFRFFCIFQLETLFI